MATTVLEVLIKARDDTAQAMNSVQGRMKSLGKTARTAGLAMTAGVTIPLIGAGVAAVSAASDLVEAQNKAIVIFGKSAQAVEAFAMISANAYGISRRGALEYTASIGTIFRGSGFAEEASKDLSLSIVELAADLGSINNIPFDVALDKLKSGLVGQSRPLRDIGVLLNETDVALHAVTIGLAESGEELSNGQKVLARYSLIMEKTKLSQGDFERTSEDLANAQKRLGARFEDLRGSIGQALLPVALKLVQWGNSMVTVGERLNATFQALSPRMKVIVGVILLIAIAMGPLLLAFATFLVVLPFMISGAVALGGAFMFMLSPIGLVILAILALVAVGVLIFIFWGQIKAGAVAFGEIMRDLPGIVGKGLLAIVKATLEAMGAMGKAMIQTAINIVKAIIEILSFWKHFGSTMTQVYGRAGREAGDEMMDSMMSAISRQTRAVVAVLREPLERLRGIVRSLGAELQRLAGLATVESSAEDIRLAELRLEVLKLEAQAVEELAERDAELAQIAETLADKEDELANIQLHLGFVTGDLKWELVGMKIALEKEIAALEDQQDAVENSLGPAERAIKAKQAEIRELELLQDLRRTERDLVVATSQAKDATLPTDAAVIASIQNMGNVIDVTTSAIDTQAAHLMTIFIPAWQDAETVALDAGDALASGLGEDMDSMLGSAGDMAAGVGGELDGLIEDFDAAEIDLSEFGIEFDEIMDGIETDFEDMAFDIKIDLKGMVADWGVGFVKMEIAIFKWEVKVAIAIGKATVALLNFGADAIDAIRSAFGFIAANVGTWIGAITSAIVRNFFPLAQTLWNIGNNAGSAFLRGLTSGAGGFFSSAFGFVVEVANVPANPVRKQTGGIVPGAAGQPVPIIAHGGERVLTQTQSESLMRALGGRGESVGTAQGGAQYITINHLTVEVTDGDLRTVLRGIGVNL